MSLIGTLRKTLVDSRSEKSIAFKFRQRRAVRILALINDCYQKYHQVNIVDIGGTRAYWDIIPYSFLKEKNVHISLVNLNANNPLSTGEDVFSYVSGNGCALTAFEDKSFHIAHSNSVIEHVGKWDDMLRFSNETKRVADSWYLQTPNYWFPFEPHFVVPFFHWLPRRIRVIMVMRFRLGWGNKPDNIQDAKALVNSCNLLCKRKLRKLFPEGSFFKERFLFLNKSHIVIKNGFY